MFLQEIGSVLLLSLLKLLRFDSFVLNCRGEMELAAFPKTSILVLTCMIWVVWGRYIVTSRSEGFGSKSCSLQIDYQVAHKYMVLYCLGTLLCLIVGGSGISRGWIFF